ncbi:hypothetical protein AKJ55_01120 [candidate division MSBL1 archaeon SCGC-AAA382M17]|uniref:dihydropteroate synthase n=1 Tax=candidate division MSBL1 archaeon SCGC-AAA382M17 TaxID=1698284 RepID=A0ABR5TJI8_9EURY|nr:hypothetical protein AKJ55_01120 [candidate division MSBL1 archaeon SCGC-AAA382M17]
MEFAGISLENKIIMGVLNLSPETFYQGSLAKNADEAANRAKSMVEDGAQIIDIGGMSTGPDVDPISEKEETDLLLPAIRAVREKIEVPISVDTQRAKAAKKALEAGADIINDVSGFKADPEMPQVAAEKDCPAILMASRITGRIRTAEKEAKDIENIKEIKEALKESLQICEEYGVDTKKISVDPAIGFGKGPKWDLKVLARLDSLKELGLPICIGVSRKSFLGKVLGLDEPSERLPASLGATAVAVMKGADLVRTHDPKETTQLIRIIEAIGKEGKSK